MSRNVRVIVKDWLEINGYDGLYNEVGECGCDLDDLMACAAEGIDGCVPAYKLDCSGCASACLEDYNYMMAPTRECQMQREEAMR